MPGWTCIYCRAESKKKFAREHVIPAAFGMFRHNFTVHCVCGTCNQFFGDFLEPVLSRGTLEGFLRWEQGGKSWEEVNKLDSTRLTAFIATEGDWKGAIVKLRRDPAQGKMDPIPVAQVGFRTKGEGTWHWLTEDQISQQSLQPFRSLDLDIKITGPSEQDWDRLASKLASLGIKFKKSADFSSPLSQTDEILIGIDGSVDQPVVRCVAKIAFNYVAKMQGPEFALKYEFDEFRTFARYGCMPTWQPFVFDSRPILADETSSIRCAKGHLITFDWNAEKDGFVVQVSLFNSITYRFRLCGKYSGLWFPVRVGHFFDVNSHTISKLGAVERALFRAPTRSRRFRH